MTMRNAVTSCALEVAPGGGAACGKMHGSIVLLLFLQSSNYLFFQSLGLLCESNFELLLDHAPTVEDK